MLDRSGLQDYSDLLIPLRQQLGEEQWQELVQTAEPIRAAALEEVRQRFEKEGRDLLALPDEDD